jgi:hypothetical protein
MAENRWISTGSTVYSVGVNWSLGAKPASGDDVVVGAGTADILTGFDVDGLTFDVRSFHRHPDYTGNIGSPGDPLVLATETADVPVDPSSSQGKVIVQGPGDFYYSNNSWGGTDGLYVDADAQDAAIEANGFILRLYCLKGRIKVLSGAAVGSIEVGWRANPATDVHLTLQVPPGEVFSINQAGGTVINTGAAPVTFLAISGGTFDHGINGGQITSLVQTGGLMIHRSAASTTSASILGGTCDYSQDVRAKLINKLRVYPGATFKPNAHVTVNVGGSILPILNTIPQSF